jgi:hypothetical protein
MTSYTSRERDNAAEPRGGRRLVALPLAIAVLAFAACGKSNNTDNVTTADVSSNAMTADMGSADMATVDDDASMPGDGGITADTGPNGDDAGMADTGVPTMLQESEPNGGATFEGINDWPIGAQMSGNIDVSDSDVFFVDATAGAVYTVSLVVDRGSQLQPHVAVFDAGRDGSPAADDYIKIVRGAGLSFLAMGTGGYYVAVRDARNVDGDAVGGADFGYLLTVEESAPQAQPLTFPSTLTGTLDGPGGVDLWAFDGAEGMDVRFDFSTTGELDGRLFVFSTQTGSWIARQDNRTAGDPNPLLDAPLFASGPMYLVVESIAEDATSLGYSIDASAP